MSAHTVFEATTHHDDQFVAAKQEGYRALGEATALAYDDVSHFEYFVTRTDGGQVWRAYAHKGLDMFVAEVINYTA